MCTERKGCKNVLCETKGVDIPGRRVTPLKLLVLLGRAVFSPRLNRRSTLSKLTRQVNVVNMSALVTYGGSDEEDAVESITDRKPAFEVRLNLSTSRFMAMADCIDLRLQLRLGMLVM